MFCPMYYNGRQAPVLTFYITYNNTSQVMPLRLAMTALQEFEFLYPPPLEMPYLHQRV